MQKNQKKLMNGYQVNSKLTGRQTSRWTDNSALVGPSIYGGLLNQFTESINLQKDKYFAIPLILVCKYKSCIITVLSVSANVL